MEVANTLAYHTRATITSVKSFIVQALLIFETVRRKFWVILGRLPSISYTETDESVQRKFSANAF